MLSLVRLMLLIAVAALATSPVMACCLSGHNGPQPEIIEVEASHCHGDHDQTQGSAAQQEHRNLPSPIDCPGCLDCDVGTLQAQSIEDGALNNQTPSKDVQIAIRASHFDGFEHNAVVFKTGPPGYSPGRPDTPVILKQRLLI